MKKKLFAMLLTAALVAAQGVTAFAAVGPSPETGGVVTDPSGNKVVESQDPGVSIEQITAGDVTEIANEYPQDIQETVKAQLTAATKGSASEIISTMTETAKTALSGTTMLPAVFDVNANGKKEITLYVPTIPENKSVYALHLTANGTWEMIPASRNGAYITLSSDNWSPVVLVYKDAVVAPVNDGRRPGEPVRGEPGYNGPDVSERTFSTSSPAVFVTSPQTGVASDWSLWMGAAVVLLAVSSVLFRRKEA